MVGIKDIAKKAGVSISTVSYALNDSPKVTEETRERIKAIARELNYIPNMAARTLKRRQTNIIAVYLTDYAGSFYGELLDGIKKGLQVYGYEMIVCSGSKSQLFIPEKMVDGAIVLDWTFKSEDIIKFANRGHHMVVLDRIIEHPNICKILLDNKGGSTLAIEQLVSRHTKKVYLITGPKNGHDSQERLKASEKELNRYGIDYELIPGDFTEPSGYDAARKIFSDTKDRPISIFAFNDEMAIGVYSYADKHAEVIGADVRLIGFDNMQLGSFLKPRLATISYSKHRWGMVAAEKIVRLVKGKKAEDELIYTSFVAGKSFP